MGATESINTNAIMDNLVQWLEVGLVHMQNDEEVKSVLL